MYDKVVVFGDSFATESNNIPGHPENRDFLWFRVLADYLNSSVEVYGLGGTSIEWSLNNLISYTENNDIQNSVCVFVKTDANRYHLNSLEPQQHAVTYMLSDSKWSWFNSINKSYIEKVRWLHKELPSYTKKQKDISCFATCDLFSKRWKKFIFISAFEDDYTLKLQPSNMTVYDTFLNSVSYAEGIPYSIVQQGDPRICHLSKPNHILLAKKLNDVIINVPKSENSFVKDLYSNCVTYDDYVDKNKDLSK